VIGDKSFFLGLLAVFFVVPSIAAATGADCIDEKSFDFFAKEFNLSAGKPTKDELCKKNSKTYKLLRVLEFLKELQFESKETTKSPSRSPSQPPSSKIPWNQNIIPSNPYAYFKAQTKAILSGDESFCEETGFTAYIEFEKPGSVFLCAPFYDDRTSLYENLETLLHEVRHFAGHDHVTCTRGPKKGGEGLCDRSLEQKGSYAVSLEANLKMALQSSQVPAPLRSMMKASAMTIANELFNKPIQTSGLQAVILTSVNGERFFFDGKKMTPFALTAEGTISSQERDVSFFPMAKGDVLHLDLYSSSMFHRKPEFGLLLSYNELPQEKRKNLVSYISNSKFMLLIHEEGFRGGLNEDPGFYEANFPFQITKVFSSQQLGSKETSSLFLVTSKDQLMRLKLLSSNKYQLAEVKDSHLKELAKSISFAEVNQKKLRLSSSGILEISKNGNKNWIPHSGAANGMKFKAMTESFYWSDLFYSGNEGI